LKGQDAAEISQDPIPTHAGKTVHEHTSSILYLLLDKGYCCRQNREDVSVFDVIKVDVMSIECLSPLKQVVQAPIGVNTHRMNFHISINHGNNAVYTVLPKSIHVICSRYISDPQQRHDLLHSAQIISSRHLKSGSIRYRWYIRVYL
jgi:hypothetical protein